MASSRTTATRVAAATAAAAFGALAAGCSGSSHPDARPTPSRPPATTATPPPAPTTSAGPSAPPSYTPPPGRHVTRPPGLPPIPGNDCGFATIAGRGAVGAWTSAVEAFAEDGEAVPADEWQEAATTMPSFLSGPPQTVARLRAAHVPASHVVFRDLAELTAATNQAISVARAQDDSKAVAVYFRLRTAQDHLIESCGALEGPPN